MLSGSFWRKEEKYEENLIDMLPIRDITDKLRKYFSEHLVVPNKKLHSKF